MQKGLTQSGNQIYAKEKQKILEYFCSKTEAIMYRNLPPKISETNGNIQFDTNQTDFRFHRLHMYLWE